MVLEEALAGKEIPDEVRKNLVLVTVPYISFDGDPREGQLVLHGNLVDDVQKIFNSLFEMKFPIERMIPIVAYTWDDEVSMEANNSSAFNYRLISGTDRLSNHSYGQAIDINPVQNPYIQRDGLVVPVGAHYDPTKKGTVTDSVASIFKSYGWEWGGDWKERKDWQHFEKTNSSAV